MQRSEVKEDIIPASDGVDARSLIAGDELREPSIVGVTGEVAGFDLAVPETWNEDQERKEKNGQAVGATEEQRITNRGCRIGLSEGYVGHRQVARREHSTCRRV